MAKLKGLFQRGRKWWLRYTPARGAKQERIPLNTADEDTAAMLALQIMHKAPLEPAGNYQRELDAYLAEGFSREMLSSEVVTNRRYLLEALARDLQVTSIDDISVKLVERWMSHLTKGPHAQRRKPETVQSYIFGLRSFCEWLVRKNKLRSNPVSSIQFGKRVKTWRKDFVPKAKVAELFLAADNDEMRFILYCGMQHGFRKKEIVEAAPEWFRLGDGGRRGCIIIGRTPTFRPKDRDERTIPLSSEFEDFLRRYLPTLPGDARWVLRPEKKPKKWRYRYEFRKPFAELMKAQGVKCTPHDMRRTFVSNKLIDNPGLLPKLSKWTGDDVKTMMDHYAHFLADDDDIDAGL